MDNKNLYLRICLGSDKVEKQWSKSQNYFFLPLSLHNEHGNTLPNIERKNKETLCIDAFQYQWIRNKYQEVICIPEHDHKSATFHLPVLYLMKSYLGVLQQKWTNLLSKGPDSRHFRLEELDHLYCNYLTLLI